ncbi:MAG TPA: lipid-A-disaccharide synthase, partial [Candidatus Hydrogenedentes bacterium]|nr:lipid-A-disaccharide synthase [Candidatus Hydrogenedentota bacterium]
VPMCIVYRVNPISYWLARALVHIRFIGIVNILAEREIVPEFIQGRAVAKKITPVLRALLAETETRHHMLADFQELKRRLGGPGASRRAAREILRIFPHSPMAS